MRAMIMAQSFSMRYWVATAMTLVGSGLCFAASDDASLQEEAKRWQRGYHGLVSAWEPARRAL